MRQASAHTRGARRSDTRRGSSGVPARPRRCSEAEPERVRLGTTATPLRQQDESAEFSRFVWGLQRTMWQVTDLKRLAGCHRWRAPGAGVASVVWQGEGSSRWGGLQKSGSVWASPLSSVKISNRRAEEVHKAVRNWVADGDRAVSFLTLTLRHNARQSLADVWSTLAACWSAVTRGASWYGGKRQEGDKKQFGITHWIKAVEVTHGKNGWHAHLHVLLLTEHELTPDQQGALRGRIFKRWAAAAERKGFAAPTMERGVVLEQAVRSTSDEDMSRLSKYVTKSNIIGLAREVTGGQMKTARESAGPEKNRTPFEILRDMKTAIDAGEEVPALDLALWREWESTSSGKRQMAWSKGAKDALGVDELTDEEIEQAAEEEHPENVAVAEVDAEDWREICSDVDLRLNVTEFVAKAKSREDARRRAGQILTALEVPHRLVMVDLSEGEDSRTAHAERLAALKRDLEGAVLAP